MSGLITVKWDGEEYLFPRSKLCSSFSAAIQAFKKAFNGLNNVCESTFTVYTNAGIDPSKQKKITDLFWTETLAEVDEISLHCSSYHRQPSAEPLAEASGLVQITVRKQCGGSFVFSDFDISQPVTALYHAVSAQLEWVPTHEFSLLVQSRRLFNTDALLSEKLEDAVDDNNHVTMYVMLAQGGGKPVIYLFPPQEQQVSVDLQLCPSWQLSAIYPANKDNTFLGGNAVSWNVKARPDGLLKDSAGRDYSFLYWESENVARALTPADKSGNEFDPLTARISPSDSVKLSRAAIAPYLHSILPGLGMHPEAVTSFITYWLPKFLQHENIALRFVKQSEYEQSAKLDIIPMPDTVIRVFMLFTGLDSQRAAAWSGELEFDWAKVIGVNGTDMDDQTKFRVLEWGGMEVL